MFLLTVLNNQVIVLTVVRVTMIRLAAQSVIQVMAAHNENNSRKKEPEMPLMPYFFREQEQHANSKQDQWPPVMVVLSPAMI